MPKTGTPWIYLLAYSACYPAARILRGMRVEGAENIPRSGRVIVAANHISWLDPPLVSMAIYSKARFPRFLAKEELFRVPILGWFLRGIGCIPLDRGHGDVGAIRRAMSVLEEEGCVVLFPEGTRSKTGLPGKPKAGVGLLARAAGAQVVPARVWNTCDISPLRPMRVRFGRPFPYHGSESREDGRAFAEKVMEEILKLN